MDKNMLIIFGDSIQHTKYNIHNINYLTFLPIQSEGL